MSKSIPIIEKHSLVLRISHWLNVPLLLIMVWSGLLIYWAHQPYIRIPNDLGPFKIHHRLAEGMGWHFFIMWVFYLNGLVYLSHLIFSGEWRNLIPDRKTFKTAFPYLLYDLKLKKEAPDWEGKFNPAQKMAYSGVILMAIGSLITGLAIYKPVQLGFLLSILGGYEAARFEHFILMIGFIIFIILHVAQVIRAGWNNFRAMLAGYEIEKN